MRDPGEEREAIWTPNMTALPPALPGKAGNRSYCRSKNPHHSVEIHGVPVKRKLEGDAGCPFPMNTCLSGGLLCLGASSQKEGRKFLSSLFP